MRSFSAPPTHLKNLPGLALLTILILGSLLFDRSCLALKCQAFCEKFGEDCDSRTIQPCSSGEICVTNKYTHEGQVLGTLAGCGEVDPDRCIDRVLGQNPYCFKATNEKLTEAVRQCNSERSGEEANKTFPVPVGVRMGGQDNMPLARLSNDEKLKIANLELCTCTTDLCNNPCRCGSGSGSGGGGSGQGVVKPKPDEETPEESSAIGVLPPAGLMITTGLAMITLVFVSAPSFLPH